MSCYGNDHQSDTGDNWVVHLEKSSQWNKDAKVRLMHVDTGAYLGSHDKKFGRPIAGQQEVRALVTMSGLVKRALGVTSTTLIGRPRLSNTAECAESVNIRGIPPGRSRLRPGHLLPILP